MIDFNIVKEKYPKSYDLLLEYGNFYEEKDFTKNDIIYLFLGGYNKHVICYCDLEKFFDDNRIIIYINYYHYRNQFKFWIKFNINSLFESCFIDLRQEAKENAIYKAFEILNEKLREVK